MTSPVPLFNLLLKNKGFFFCSKIEGTGNCPVVFGSGKLCCSLVVLMWVPERLFGKAFIRPITNAITEDADIVARKIQNPTEVGLADRTGLEPATSAVTGRHSNQLNYRSLNEKYILLFVFRTAKIAFFSFYHQNFYKKMFPLNFTPYSGLYCYCI